MIPRRTAIATACVRIACAELVHDMPDVDLFRLLRDEKLFGDVPVSVSMRDLAEHLRLAIGQVFDGTARPTIGSLFPMVNEASAKTPCRFVATTSGWEAPEASNYSRRVNSI